MILLMIPLNELVKEALDNAADNGYDPELWDIDELAEDLNRYCSDLEGIPPSCLIPHIRAWIALKGN